MADSSFNPFFLLPLLLVVVATTARNVVVEAAPDLTRVSSFCGTYREVSDFRKDQAGRAVKGSAKHTHPGDTNRCMEIGNEPVMYSAASCSGSVSQEDCTACINYAGDQLMNRLCEDHYGAQLTVISCSMRYEINPIEECPGFQ